MTPEQQHACRVRAAEKTRILRRPKKRARREGRIEREAQREVEGRRNSEQRRECAREEFVPTDWTSLTTFCATCGTRLDRDRVSRVIGAVHYWLCPHCDQITHRTREGQGECEER